MCVSLLLEGFSGQSGDASREIQEWFWAYMAAVTCWVPKARLEVAWCREDPPRDPGAAGASCLQQPRGPWCQGLPLAASATRILPWKHALREQSQSFIFSLLTADPAFTIYIHRMKTVKSEGMGHKAGSTTAGGDPSSTTPAPLLPAVGMLQ